VLVQHFQNIVDDFVLSFGEQVWLGESRFSSARTGPKGRKLVEKVKVMLRELQQSEADDCQGFG